MSRLHTLQRTIPNAFRTQRPTLNEQRFNAQRTTPTPNEQRTNALPLLPDEADGFRRAVVVFAFAQDRTRVAQMHDTILGKVLQ